MNERNDADEEVHLKVKYHLYLKHEKFSTSGDDGLAFNASDLPGQHELSISDLRVSRSKSLAAKVLLVQQEETEGHQRRLNSAGCLICVRHWQRLNRRTASIAR